MRLLFWTELFHPHIGGIEVRSGELLAELCRRGHQCEVITNQVPEALPRHDTRRGVAVHRLPYRQAVANRNLRLIQTSLASIQTIKTDFKPEVELVFVSGPLITLQCMANRKESVPTVASLQGQVEDYVEANSAILQSLKSCHAIVTVSEHLQRAVCERLPDLSGKTHLLLNSLPSPSLQPGPLPLETPVVLALGRLVQEKGIDLVVKAMPHVVESTPNARLIIAGDGPEKPALEALTHQLKLQNHVTFTGWVPPEEVPQLMNQASVVVMPSRWQEAFGLVSLQAAQMGRPVVAAAVGAQPEIVVHGETGLLVEQEDVEGLAKALCRLLHDPEEMLAMSVKARARAREHFDFDAYVTRYKTLLQSMMTARSSGREPG